MSAEPIRLQIDRVSKTYGSRRVLRTVSADLVCGDILLVTGPNGAGKSTLLRIVAGLLRPTEGAVYLLKGDRRLAPPEWRSCVGFVSPDIRLYRELTAGEHLRFVAAVRGLRVDERICRLALERVGLAGREADPVGDYSTGMRQRLQFALALLLRPAVLLLDEPATNLDQAGIELVDNFVEEVASGGIVVIATNDPRDMRHADLVLALDTPVDG